MVDVNRVRVSKFARYFYEVLVETITLDKSTIKENASVAHKLVAVELSGVIDNTVAACNGNHIRSLYCCKMENFMRIVVDLVTLASCRDQLSKVEQTEVFPFLMFGIAVTSGVVPVFG